MTRFSRILLLIPVFLICLLVTGLHPVRLAVADDSSGDSANLNSDPGDDGPSASPNYPFDDDDEEDDTDFA